MIGDLDADAAVLASGMLLVAAEQYGLTDPDQRAVFDAVREDRAFRLALENLAGVLLAMEGD